MRERFIPKPEYGDREFGRPSLVALMAMMTGMAVARASDLQSLAPVLLLMAGGFTTASLFRSIPRGRLVPLLFLFFSLGVGMQAPLNRADSLGRIAGSRLEASPGRFVTITGELADGPRLHENGATIWLEEGAHLAKGEVRVYSPAPVPIYLRDEENRARELAPGDRIMALGRLTPLSNAPGSSDAWLTSQGGVFHVLAAQWSVEAPQNRKPFDRFRHAMRRAGDRIESVLADSMNDREAAVMIAMMLGRTGKLNDQQRSAFTRTGLMHLFSVSGLHAGLAGVFLAAIATLLGLGPRWRALIVIVGLVLFCTLTGLRSSALRAALLMSVFFLQPLVRRNIEPLGTLASVALILLAFRPRALWQVDFQLSFLCAVTLVIVAPGAVAIETYLGQRLPNSWRFHWRALILMAQTAFVSLCLQVALAPITICVMGNVSLISPVANMLVLPMIFWVMSCGIVAVFLSFFFPFFASGLFVLLEWSIIVMQQLAGALAMIPGAALEHMRPWPTWASGLFYILLLGGNWMQYRPRFTPFERLASGVRQCTAAFVMVLWLPFIAPNEPLLKATFLEVGQGDAVLLQTRSGAAMLVDAGPPQGPGLVRELRRRGVEQLDLLVLTHADADHIGGAAELINDMPPARLIANGAIANTETWQGVADAVRRWNVPVTAVRRGARFSLDRDVNVRVLHPTDDFLEEGDDRNEGSVVMMIEAGEVRMLLTGDAERQAELAMLSEEMDLRADILKAGHHGSESSTTLPFLATVRPQIAIISCGRNNRYGHPHPEVMARLAEMGTLTYRTDLQGTIVIETDGKVMHVRKALDVQHAGTGTRK